MSRALSDDLRQRVIEAVDGGMSRRGAARRFGIGEATANRWVRRWRGRAVGQRIRGVPNQRAARLRGAMTSGSRWLGGGRG